MKNGNKVEFLKDRKITKERVYPKGTQGVLVEQSRYGHGVVRIPSGENVSCFLEDLKVITG